MSVIKSKRNLSGVQFIDTARELHVFTLRTTKKFPKSYYFSVTQYINQSVNLIRASVERGNKIYPSCAENKRLRYEQMMMGYAELSNLIAQIDTAYLMFPIADKTMIKWMELIDTENKLLKSLLKKEQQNL